MQDHLMETTGKRPTLREVGEMLQGYIQTNQIVTPEQSSYRVGSSSITTDELHFYLGQLKSYRGDYLQNRESPGRASKVRRLRTPSMCVR